MKKPATTFRVFIILLGIFQASFSFSQTTIIPYGSTWKYLDNNTRPANWQTTGFNDASWASGPAELGYADAPVTTVSYGSDANNKYITTYFRIAVNIPNPALYTNFTLNVRRDDGIVVYINGTERYADNMPAGRTHATLASAAASDDGATPQTTSLSSAFFSAGSNVIAVEIHQNAVTSTDLTFDLELVGNSAPVGLINFGDTWKYLDNNTRPANWQTTGYNDAAWASGASELGYADAPATTVSYGSDANNKYITTYFRKTFNVTGISGYSSFTMNVVRDDGVVVYINGNEVARDNMPGGTPAHNTLASAAISGTGETTPISFSVSPCSLVEGTNTIAVEMHQNDVTSSDLSFNMELIGNVGGGTPTLSRGPYLQKGTQTSMTFRWRTSAICYGRVEVGASVGNYTIATADETGCATTEHIVTVTGLSTDTKYYYRIGTTTGTVFQGAADNFFSTLPLPNTTRKIRVVAFGDCGRGNTTYQDQNLSNYQSYLSTNGIDAPDAWLLLGDNAYSSGTDAEYTSNFFGIYGNTILKNHKLYPAPGNHDYGNNTANKASRSMAYHGIFSTPFNGEAGGVASGKQNFYSYDIGNIHFLSLDSWGIESDATHMGQTASMLKTWVTADLAANTRKWIVAYWHHGGYTKGSHDSDSESELVNIRQNFASFLESQGVDLIICGHSHVYERSYLLKGFTGAWTSFSAGTHAVSTSSATYDDAGSCPYVYNSSPSNHGTVYITAGSTGASTTTPFANFDAYAFPFSVNDGGVFYFEVEDNRLDAKMLRRNGSVFDRFTIIKDANKNTSYNVVVNTPVTLTASWPGSYTWNTAATSRSISYTPTTTGTTNFNVTDQYGCVTDQFSITASGLLPVTLLNYTAVLSGGKVNTSWTTSNETNSKFFTVERTQNLRDYELVGQVNAAGKSDTEKKYAVTDYNPYPGISYYRLSQTDQDGKTHYYDVKKIVNNTNKNFTVSQVANESSMLVLLINSATADRLRLKIFDISGKEISSEVINVTAGSKRKENRLKPGSYVWEVRNSKGEVISQATIVK